LVPEGLSPGVKRPGREADHSTPRAKVKNAWRYNSTLQYVFMVWCLVKHRDNFTFTLPSGYTTFILNILDVVKVKVKVSLCLTKHHAIKTY
jgi:hypothetical protein